MHKGAPRCKEPPRCRGAPARIPRRGAWAAGAHLTTAALVLLRQLRHIFVRRP
ncbi:hypothetical protein C2S52_014103 [Perilla frutescens var. hirtella]|nr:hypothetical protein C2S52_014103 [Perilla frutescens var. hirtella]